MTELEKYSNESKSVDGLKVNIAQVDLVTELNSLLQSNHALLIDSLLIMC